MDKDGQAHSAFIAHVRYAGTSGRYQRTDSWGGARLHTVQFGVNKCSLDGALGSHFRDYQGERHVYFVLMRLSGHVLGTIRVEGYFIFQKRDFRGKFWGLSGWKGTTFCRSGHVTLFSKSEGLGSRFGVYQGEEQYLFSKTDGFGSRFRDY